MNIGVSARSLALALGLLTVSLAPLSAFAADPITYTPKVIKAKCVFPSDKVIVNTIAEKIKIDLASKGIAKPSLRIKLNALKPAPAADTVDLGSLSFTVTAPNADAPLAYNILGAANANQAISFSCTQDRILDISVSAKIAAAKVSSAQHIHVFVQGSLK